MSTPLTSRKLDILYLIFFTIHIPVILLVDIVPLYPASLTPSISISLREYYIKTYRDKFFIDPPLWFWAYLGVELLGHLPGSVWMVWGLWRDEGMTAVGLLVFGVQNSVTTLTCLVEMCGWDGYTGSERWRLGALYGPYLGVAVLMSVDAMVRLRRVILMGKEKKS